MVEVEIIGCDKKLLYIWASGFIDGEGYFHMQKTKSGYRTPRIEVSQVELSSLKRLKRIFGGYILKLKLRDGRKQTYRWDLKGKDAVAFAIKSMLPYLTVKKKDAKLILKYCRTCKSRGCRYSVLEKKNRSLLYEELLILRGENHRS